MLNQTSEQELIAIQHAIFNIQQKYKVHNMMKHNNILRALSTPLLITAILALAGCAGQTSYSPQSSNATQDNNGYTSQQIMPDRYKVKFSGNKFTSRETVDNYLLYRAADLTQQQGYDNFLVVQEDTDRSTQMDIDTVTTTGVSMTYPAFSPYYNFYGSTFGSYGYDPYSNRQFNERRITVEQIERFDASAIIEMFNADSSQTGEQVYNASQVMERIGPVETPDMY